MRGTNVWRRRVVVSAAVAAVVVMQPAERLLAASAVWNGDDATAGTAGSNVLWSDANSWTTGGNVDTAPTDTAPGDDLSFGTGTAGGVIDLGGARVANSLAFNRTYTLGLAATANTLTVATGPVSVTAGTTATINAIYAGTAGLALTGGGTLVINRATGNTFTGNVTVDGAGTTLAYLGTNSSADPTALGAGAKSITLTNGGTVSVTGGTLSNPTSGSKGFVIGTGGGTIDTASGQTLQLDDGSQISGSATLTKTGAGTLFLDNQGFNFTGAVNLNGGTLRLARNAGILGTSAATVAPITVASGATYNIEITQTSLRPITISGTGVGNGGALVDNSTTAATVQAVTLAADASVGGSGNLTIAGVVSGGFNLTKVGAGTTILAATNTYSGNTTIAGGAIRGTIGTNVPTTGNLTLNGGAFETVAATYSGTLGTGAGQVQLPGGTSGFSSGLAAGNTVNLNGAATQLVWGTTANFNPSALLLSSPTALGTLNFQNPIDLNGATRTVTANAATAAGTAATLSGAITGTGGLTKAGTGVIVLGSTSNAYTGTTLVSGGVLRGTLGTTIPAAGNTTLNGGALETAVDVTNFGTGPGQVQVTGGTSGFSAFGAAINVNVGGAGAPVTWGAATFNPSTLVLNAASANNAINFVNPIDLNAATRTVQVNANTATISNVISTGSGTAGLTKNGNGTLVLTANNTYNGTTTISAGTLTVSTDNNLGPITNPLVINGGILGVAGTAMTSVGARPLTLGTGTAGFDIIDPANNFTVTRGTALTTGTFTKNGAGTLTLSLPATGNVISGQLNVNAGVLDIGAATITVSNNGGNGLRATANATINATGGGKLLFSSNGTTTTTDFLDNSTSAGVTLTVNAQVGASSANGGFEYCCDSPGGTILLNNAANDFAGQVILNQPGTIAFRTVANSGTASSLGTGTQINFNVSNTPGARIQYVGTGDSTNRTLALTQNGVVDQSGTGLLNFTGNTTAGTAVRTLTLQGSTEGVGQISGVIAANTAITKAGTGTWILSGANLYTGATTVTAGTLQVNNSTGSGTGTGAVAVNGTGTLGGTGTISGAVTLAAGVAGPGGGPAISPGAGTGILRTGNLALGSRSDAIFELLGTTAGTGHDQLSVTGTVSLGNADLVISSVAGLELGQQYTIISNDGADAVTGTFFTGSTVTGPNGSAFSIAYNGGDGNDVVLTTTAVPEPASAGLLAAAAAGLLARRRRRQD